jgi:hypothetical protein
MYFILLAVEIAIVVLVLGESHKRVWAAPEK